MKEVSYYAVTTTYVDQNCVDSIQNIASQLVKNNQFMNKVYASTQSKMAQDLRKSGCR